MPQSIMAEKDKIMKTSGFKMKGWNGYQNSPVKQNGDQLHTDKTITKDTRSLIELDSERYDLRQKALETDTATDWKNYRDFDHWFKKVHLGKKPKKKFYLTKLGDIVTEKKWMKNYLRK